MTNDKLTEREIYLMKHALGIPDHDYKKGVSHRNYFASYPNGENYDAWVSLVERGYAETWKPFDDSKMKYFGVKDEFKKQLGVKKEVE